VAEDGTWHEIKLPDGRVIEAVTSGPVESGALLFHLGTPNAALLFSPIVAAAARHDLPVVMFSRPGYAGSTPQPGRSVADVVPDTTSVLDAVGVESFVTIGWSGGGPHALACAALLPDRCQAAVSLAGVAPYGVERLDFLAGMGEENIEEFGAALEGVEPLTKFLQGFAPVLAELTGADVAASLGDLISDVDRAALTGDFADFTATAIRRAVSNGIAGWRDDDLAFTQDWGFDLAAIKRPVAVWQGAQDRMVPYAHGEWLAAHVPGAVARLFRDEGHLSLAVARLDDIVDDLVSLAGGR
jgi:pimeloyl-ACP methyl ester carboxylesterase